MINAPAFVYSQNDNLIFLRPADSATIKFATEPSRVKFPANVELAASVIQPAVGLFSCAINDFKSKTAGTLETRLLNTAVMTLRSSTDNSPKDLEKSLNRAVIPFDSRAPVTINRPAKNTRISQSIDVKILFGFIRRVKSSNTAAINAAKAIGTPARKAINRATVMMRVLTISGR